MAIPVTVPRLGWSMEEGTFLQWLKNDGDDVRAGEPLFVLEGEKAAEDVEALDAGTLHLNSGGPRPGDRVKVGEVIAHLAAHGEVLTPSQNVDSKPVPALAPPAGPSARRLARSLGVAIEQVSASGPTGRITEEDIRRHRQSVETVVPAVAVRNEPVASPRARRTARERGIDWKSLQGSGPNGRIRERDVCAAPARKTDGRLIPHTTVRRTIAARMVAGVTQAAPVTLTTRIDATNLVSFREQFKSTGTTDAIVPSYTDLIVKLCAVALRQHPLLQAQWREDGLFVPERIDIAIAVDTDGGLLVPVLRSVDQLGVRPLAAQARELVELARAGRLSAEQMRDATFTVTNLGSLGIDAFTPILNLPQCAILGVGRIVREPTVVNDQVVVRDRMTLSLTFDHRIVDGAPAARFLDTLRRCLEQPVPWLVP
ncbi:MAG: 2-oxo acid dehydrogenase subunit E2 [Gemmataceae bacterium]|nr:2-oxo acid dehydrogenase subunit E2 [Gemmataceae bacterium]